MASRKSSAGERVLEGRHVIGLFFLMLLFSGVFFTLGYVMGRNQLDAQVRAASSHGNSDPATDAATPPSSEWEFYRAGDKNSSNDHLKPAPAASSAQQKTITTSAKSASSPAGRSNVTTPAIPRGSYLLQVVALRTDSDAISIANELRKKKFPAFVQAPQSDKYYRVQVGPYADQKAMQTARKGLETAGFKAIIKH